MAFDLPLIGELAVKTAVVASVALCLLRLLRRRSAGERSVVAHLALLAIVALPASTLLLPTWNPLPVAITAPAAAESPVLPDGVAGGIDIPAEIAKPANPMVTPQAIAIAIYLGPLLLLLATMVLAVGRLFAVRRRAAIVIDAPWLAALAQAQRRMGFKHGTALLVSDEVRSPISEGVMRPTIVLDRQMVGASAEAEAIIAHELAHVARLDWAKLLLARVACALFWFNPLVWLLTRESHQLREEAADDAVLLSEVGSADYATLLVNAARHDNDGLLLAAHGVAPGRGSLRRRIIRVLNRELRRDPATGGFLAGGIALAIGIVTPFAALDPFAAVHATTVTLPEIAGTKPSPPIPSSSSAEAPRTARRLADAPVSPKVPARLRAPGASPADVYATRPTGDGELSVAHIVQARATGVDPAYAREIRAAFPESTIGSVVQARGVGVDPAYARAMRAADPSLTLRDVVQARAIGVSPGYQAEMRRLFPTVRLGQLTAMLAVGVTPEYVRAMRREGGAFSDPGAVVRARALDGDAARIVRSSDGRRTVVIDRGRTRVVSAAHVDTDAEDDAVVDMSE